MNPIFTKGYRAGAVISPYQIVMLSADGSIVPAADAADKSIGVTGLVGADAGGVADVHRVGIAEVKLGGTVAVGDEITSDIVGRGVTLTGTGASIGMAEQSGAAGDIINVFLRALPSITVA